MSKTVQNRAIVTNEHEQVVIYQLSNVVIHNDLEYP